MTVNSSVSSEKLCKFQNSGFCKFRTKCRNKHVLENCEVTGCDQSRCLKRHPKRCRNHFLRRFCKFKEDCQNSHGDEKTSNEEIDVVSKEIEKMKLENKNLGMEIEHLKAQIKRLNESYDKATNEVEKIKNEKAAIEIQNKHTIEINENLLIMVNVR